MCKHDICMFQRACTVQGQLRVTHSVVPGLKHKAQSSARNNVEKFLDTVIFLPNAEPLFDTIGRIQSLV